MVREMVRWVVRFILEVWDDWGGRGNGKDGLRVWDEMGREGNWVLWVLGRK